VEINTIKLKANLILKSNHSETWAKFVRKYPVVDIQRKDLYETVWELSREYTQLWKSLVESEHRSDSIYMNLWPNIDFKFDIREIVRAKCN
jgi:hypothetical protein